MIPPFDAARFFMSQGYWRSDELVDEQILTDCEAVVDTAFRNSIQPLRVNKKGEVSRVEGLLHRSGIFLELLRSDPIANGLRFLLGDAVEVARGRHNHATLNRAEDIPFRLHRDVQQWSQPLVSVFVYFTRTSSENGATVLVPGSHLLPYAGPQSAGGGGNWADEHQHYRHLLNQALSVEMPARGVLFVNSLCFHSVGPRQARSGRKSMVFACRSMDNLTRVQSQDFVSVFGRRRFVANEVLPVSGSLAAPDPKPV